MTLHPVKIIAWANVHPRLTPPQLSAAPTRDELISWLIWNDPNGVYTDENNAAEGWDPLPIEDAWRFVVDCYLEDHDIDSYAYTGPIPDLTS